MRFQARVRLSSLLFLAIYFFSSGALAHPPRLSGCGPLFDGAILNTAPECLNDSTFLVVDRSKANQYGWQYSLDSILDGVNGGNIGGGTFEYYGIAVRETETEFWVVINSNLPKTGSSSSSAQDGNIGHGDLFFNFSSGTFLQTSDTASLYAVRYASTNDSGASQTGVYSGVKGKSVTAENAGFTTLASYTQYVNQHGGIVGFGDLPANQTYYSGSISQNVIKYGSRITAINFIGTQDLTASGFNFSILRGSSTIAFRFPRASVVDACGVPGGDGTSCRDCAGVACGTTVNDQCGICGGDGTSCLDCAGTPFGETQIDACGVCGGDNSSCADCEGTPNGNAKLDQCGVCGGDGTSCLDCAGTPFGTNVFDACNVCGGDGSSCSDCTGLAFGTAVVDSCGVCGGNGTSCISCKEMDFTKVLLELDGAAFEQHRATLKAIKLLAKSGNRSNKTQTRDEAFRKQSNLIYTTTWSLTWEFPVTMKDCDPNPLCVSIDHAPRKSEYENFSSAQFGLARRIIKRLEQVQGKTRKSRSLFRIARSHYERSVTAVKNIPSKTSVCKS